MGVDEKYLGRRGKQRHDKFVTVVSDLETGEPVWFGYGRGPRRRSAPGSMDSAMNRSRASCCSRWTCTHPSPKPCARLPGLDHVAIVHHPFHVMKRAGEAVDEVRTRVLFRAGPELRAVGRGKRWLFLRSAARLTDQQRREVATLLRVGPQLAPAEAPWGPPRVASSSVRSLYSVRMTRTSPAAVW